MKQVASMVMLIFCLLAFIGCTAPASNTGLPTASTVEKSIAQPSPSASLAAGTSTVSATVPATVKTPEPATPTAAPPTAQPTPTEPAIETYIAYLQKGELVVTHVIGGKPLETRQYTQPGTHNWIFNIGWSPSGKYLTFSMNARSFIHLFIVNAHEGGDPVDLGIANDWAWSPDGKLLAFEHEYELWTYSPDNGKSRQLTNHLGVNWLWYTPTFTPSGDALIAAGMFSKDMDRKGNTRYKLYKVPLDGSGAAAYPPGKLPAITAEISGSRPSALRFSPDGKKLAVSTTVYSDGCAQEANYFVANADGSNLRKLSIPSLAALVDLDKQIYFSGNSQVWTPESDGMWVNTMVRDCSMIGITMVGGPQISHVTLDGQEQQIIPGIYSHLSLDHTGNLLGVVKGAGDHSHVQILGLDGHLVLDLGEGDLAVLQP